MTELSPVNQMTAPVTPVIQRDKAEARPATWRFALAGMLKLLLPLALLLGGYVAAKEILASAPVAERKARARVPRLVETIAVETADQRPMLSAWGEVRPARRLLLRPEVAGRVIAIHPNLTPGGLVLAGEELLRIDDRDLKLAVSRAEADILEIRARIAIEKGQAEIGKRELKRLSRNLTPEQRSLVLREPQMAQLQAELAAAEAARDQAEIAVGAAVVRAPFDAVVLTEDVSMGTMLTQGTQAAELVAADVFNIAIALPVTDLTWIDMSNPQQVRLTQRGVWREEQTRPGRIERLSSRLTETGRMAEIIVAVDDPMSRRAENADKPPVLLGAFLRAEIAGRRVNQAVLLDRAHLRANDTVWLMSPDDTLEVRTVTVVWRGADHVLVSEGLRPGERLITTALATHVPGMALRTRAPGAGG